MKPRWLGEDTKPMGLAALMVNALVNLMGSEITCQSPLQQNQLEVSG